MKMARKTDWPGEWFKIFEEHGYDVCICFFSGHDKFTRESHFSHSTHDGFAAALTELKAHHILTPDLLPKVPKESPFAPYLAAFLFLLSSITYLNPFRRRSPPLTGWKDQMDESAAKKLRGLDRKINHFFSIDETKIILSQIKKMDSNITVFSLRALDNATRPYLKKSDRVNTWMLPLTMRKNLSLSDTVGNKASFLTASVSPQMPIQSLQSQLKMKLVLQEHWRNYFIVNIGGLIGKRGMRWLYKKHQIAHRIGVFTNLGRWGYSGHPQSNFKIVGYQPTTAFQPFSANQAVWCGRLQICISVNPAILNEPDRAETILKKWRDGFDELLKQDPVDSQRE